MNKQDWGALLVTFLNPIGIICNLVIFVAFRSLFSGLPAFLNIPLALASTVALWAGIMAFHKHMTS
jgi:hypothetical protein